jgi:hypothetical protein
VGLTDTKVHLIVVALSLVEGTDYTLVIGIYDEVGVVYA